MVMFIVSFCIMGTYILHMYMKDIKDTKTKHCLERYGFYSPTANVFGYGCLHMWKTKCLC